MFDRMRRPSTSTAADVSSHELSMPRTIMRRRRGRPAAVPSELISAGLRRGGRLRLARVRALLLDDAHGLDDVERALELDVLLHFLRGVERRRGRLAVRILGDLDHDVGGNPLAVD